MSLINTFYAKVSEYLPSLMKKKCSFVCSVFQTVAVETTGLSPNSTSDGDDGSLTCSVTNEGFVVPCMSSSEVQACIQMFDSQPGPLLFTNGEIVRQSEVPNRSPFQLTKEPVCWIKLKRGNTIKSCYGVYLGNDYILTALHTFEYACLYDVYVFFPTTDFVLVYEAELPKEHHRFHDRDQCLVQLLGQTDVLGKGLDDRICAPRKNEDLYFYTIDRQGNLQMHKCKDVTHSSTKSEKSQRNGFVMSRAGQPGESGNPVFSLRSKKCVGIYRGITRSKKGRASKIDYKQLREYTTSGRTHLCCLNMIYRILSSMKAGYFYWLVVSDQTSADE